VRFGFQQHAANSNSHALAHAFADAEPCTYAESSTIAKPDSVGCF
jgi:hypothetical protein